RRARRRAGRLVLLACVIAIASACAPATIIRSGEGTASTPAFKVGRGTFHFHWVVKDPQTGTHGCLFGLSIDVIRSGVADPRDLPDWGSQKLMYRTVGVGAEIVADRDGIVLPAGSYLLRSEGSCSWRAEILQTEGDVVP